MPQRRTPAAPSTRPLRTDAELRDLALKALAERHPTAEPGEALAEQYPTEYADLMRAFKGARRMRTTAPRHGRSVSDHYEEGEVIENFHIVQDTDLSHESTADVVVTLHDALEELAELDRYDYTAIGRKVAGLWRDAVRRGIHLA